MLRRRFTLVRSGRRYAGSECLDAWLGGKPPAHQIDRRDALEREVDQWDSYFRIHVDRYRGNIELIRSLKLVASRTLLRSFVDHGVCVLPHDLRVLGL